MTLREATRSYLRQGCPNKSGETRTADAQELEASRLARLNRRLGTIPLDSLTIRHCAQYGAANPDRQRGADLDLQALSNLCWFAVGEGWLKSNPVIGRARTRKPKDVVHCRERMPKDGDEIHRIAREMLRVPSRQSTAWQMLYEAYTGVRTCEALAMRTDAADKQSPGYVEGNYLYIRRSKRGGFPYVRLDPDLQALIDAHREWKARCYPDSPWYFPGKFGALPLERTTLTHALPEPLTSHGLRAYYVTLHRSRGLSDERVAALIGDSSSELIQTTYGQLPESWAGGEPLTFTPRNEPLAWAEIKHHGTQQLVNT